MSNLLSSLVDNLSDKLYSDKCRDCKSYPRYMLIKDIQLIFRCFECKYIYIYIYIYIYKKDVNKDLIKRFVNIREFCDEDINKLILLLRKGIYTYEYMDS